MLCQARIDELALFDRALSDNDIADLYLAAQEEMARLHEGSTWPAEFAHFNTQHENQRMYPNTKPSILVPLIAIWLGMGENLDGRIGAVLDRIEELEIADNTYVIMVSDNGYRHSFVPGLKQPHHGAKWWVWQGGIRVPMIVKGPGIKPGSVFQGNVINYDFLPTFVDWVGGNPQELKDIDGVSLAGYMADAG